MVLMACMIAGSLKRLLTTRKQRPCPRIPAQSPSPPRSGGEGGSHCEAMGGRGGASSKRDYSVANIAAHLTFPAQARVPSLSPRDDAGGEGFRDEGMITTRARPCEAEAIRAARGATCTVRQQRGDLAATILASTIAYVDESVGNVALPAIGRDLSASPAALQWVINAYTLCLAAFLLVGGAAGDRLGRRGVFIAGVALFGAASLGCGLSRDTAQLIAARAVPRAGAALLIPCSLALIRAAFPDTERRRAIGTRAGFSALPAPIV